MTDSNTKFVIARLAEVGLCKNGMVHPAFETRGSWDSEGEATVHAASLGPEWVVMALGFDPGSGDRTEKHVGVSIGTPDAEG